MLTKKKMKTAKTLRKYKTCYCNMEVVLYRGGYTSNQAAAMVAVHTIFIFPIFLSNFSSLVILTFIVYFVTENWDVDNPG